MSGLTVAPPSGATVEYENTRRPHQEDEFTVRKLFGGAMECLLPAAYVDVSDIRQVPDHQEAFVSQSDGVSVVIEILSFQSEIPSGDSDSGGVSARHFFDDLARANGASTSVCDFCGDLTDRVMPKLQGFSKAALAGRQVVAKFRGDGPGDAVRVYLLNLRLPNVDTDMLITVNVPYPDQESAAHSPGNVDSFLPVAVHDSSQYSTSLTEETYRGEGSRLSAPQKIPIVEQESPTIEKSDTLYECAEGRGISSRESEETSAIGTEGHISCVGAGDRVFATSGVAVLRSLIESFDILDWSVFG